MHSTYTADEAAEILDWIADGKPLTEWCRAKKGRPKPRTVRDWKNARADFANAYREAREDGAAAIAEQCLTIADNIEEEAASRRVRTDVRLKLLAKWFPQVYGDKVAVEHSGMLRTSRELTDADLERIAAGSSEGATPSPEGPYLVRDVL